MAKANNATPCQSSANLASLHTNHPKLKNGAECVTGVTHSVCVPPLES